MNTLELLSNYSTDDATREKLYPLFERVFGIEVVLMKDFYARGFWNPTYTPYTLFDGDRAVANASMFTMPVVVNGKQIKAAGIQSVMTDPDYRGQGLMKKVFGQMLAEIDQAFETVFLMTEQPTLYTSFGFEQVQEHYFVTALEHQPNEKTGTLRKLDFFNEEELQIVRDIFKNQQPVSRQFAPVGYDSSFYLNMYNPFFNQKLYYSEALQAVLVLAVAEGTLKLYDVISETIPSFEEIVAEISEAFTKVEVYFNPDLFSDVTFEPVAVEGTLMVRGKFGIEDGTVKLPYTAMF